MKQYPYSQELVDGTSLKASQKKLSQDKLTQEHSSSRAASDYSLDAIIVEHFDASSDLRESLHSRVKIKKLKASDILWQAEGIQDKLYFLAKGLMYAYFNTQEGKSVCKEIYWERDLLFCFRCLLSEVRYPFSVAALEGTELYEISKETYLHWVQNNQENRDFHLSVISEYYMYKEGKEEFLLLNTPEQRVRKFYQTYPDLVKRVPQHIIASYLGITPISFSRIKKRIFG